VKLKFAERPIKSITENEAEPFNLRISSPIVGDGFGQRMSINNENFGAESADEADSEIPDGAAQVLSSLFEPLR
jgi:hypothetical protein